MIKACYIRNFPPHPAKKKGNLRENCTLQTSLKAFDYSVLRIYQVFELFGMRLCVRMCEFLYICKRVGMVLLHKALMIGIFSNYSSKIFVFLF